MRTKITALEFSRDMTMHRTSAENIMDLVWKVDESRAYHLNRASVISEERPRFWGLFSGLPPRVNDLVLCDMSDGFPLVPRNGRDSAYRDPLPSPADQLRLVRRASIYTKQEAQRQMEKQRLSISENFLQIAVGIWVLGMLAAALFFFFTSGLAGDYIENPL